ENGSPAAEIGSRKINLHWRKVTGDFWMENTVAVPSVGASAAGAVGRSSRYRWGQLVIGLLSMALVPNLPYAWTLFVSPIDQKHHWGLSAGQLAFCIFVVGERGLVPVEGWLVDKFGPRPVVAGGAILAAAAWVLNSYATTLTELYIAAVIAGLGAGAVYGTCV